MKHKFLAVLLAIVATLSMVFGSVGCEEKNPDEMGNNPPVTDPSGNQGGTQKPDEGEQGTPAPHVHSYGEWKVTKEATCKEKGTKERSCACGEKETETLPLAGHDFENMTCKVCGTKASLGLIYTLINDDKEYEVSGIGNCTDTDLIITNNYESKPVTAIGDWAFNSCSGLTSIEIPDSVTEIGDWAFFNCSGLTSITIPDSVTSIGKDAFGGCGRLEKIEVIENNLNYSSQDGILYDKVKTEFVHIPQAIKGAVTIPDSVTEIRDWAFKNCCRLSSIILPNSVITIGFAAFYGCSGLTSVTIPNSVISIGAYAFADCVELTSVNIPNGVTVIGHWAFVGCSGLTSVYISNSVTSIGSGAFCGCSGLTSVTIPASVTEIGEEAFEGCSGLTEIKVDENNQTFHVKDNCLIETKGKTLIAGYKASKIPDDGSVTSIGNYAFAACSGLTSITIPNSVTSIGRAAFAACSGLTSLTIPDSVTSIGDCAFVDCDELQEVHFENPNGWKVSYHDGWSRSFAISGLEEPAQAAKYLTDTYCGWYCYWEREG